MLQFRGKVALWAVLLAFVGSAQKSEDSPKTLPLKPERKISFTTDEGTWISLDLSPDGKTIVFELLGDLYTLPIEGGTAKRIVGGMSMDTQPAFSPDGKRIAFLSDRDGAENLWIADADGSHPKQITKETKSNFTSPTWSPDSDYVMVSRATPQSRTSELWMFHRDGGTGLQVSKAVTGPSSGGAEPAPTTSRVNALGGVFSRDGKYIYYARRRSTFSYNVNFPLWQIVRKDRVSAEEDTITSEPLSAFRPLVSPDSKMLVYATRYETQTGLRIRDLATGNTRWLKYPVQRDDQESRASRDVFPGYAFTPDGKDLILFHQGKIQRVNMESGKATVIPFSAEVSLDIGPKLDFPARVEQGPVKARLTQNAVLSPDGKQIAFSALRYLYQMTLPSGTPARLTADPNAREFLPAYSPDGRWIAYVTWSDNGGHIWKVRSDGQMPPQQLTQQAAFYQDPVWSPDGSRIVATRATTEAELDAERGAQPADLVWLPSSGGTVTVVSPARGAGRPHFVSSQPDRIYLYSSRGLSSVRYDGTDRRLLLKMVGPSRTSEPDPADDVRISPDGKFVAGIVSHQLYVSPVPHSGTDGITLDVTKPPIPIKKLTEIGADSFDWDASGEFIGWSAGASYFRLRTSSITFEEKAKPKHEEFAIDVERPRRTPSGTIVLRGAKVITMKGGETIDDADIVVKDNRIEAVGKRGSLKIATGAKIEDVKGATIIPGIIDVHAHWRFPRDVVEEQNWALAANLAYGVTSGRDPQTATVDAFANQDLVDTGDMIGTRAFSTGPGVFWSNDFQSYEQTKSALERYAKYYRTNTIKSYVVGNRKQRQWVIQACKELKLMPTTEGMLDLKIDMTHAIDGFSGNEHALPIVPLYKDVVQLFVQSGITYTPTLVVAYGGPWAENYFFETTEVYDDPKLKRFIPQKALYERASRRPWFRAEEHVFPKLAAEAAKIQRAGGRVGIGGHGQLQGIQCHWEMWAMASGGMSNLDVLRAATISGAEAIGFAQDLGSIEPGKLADLVVLRKDPLADIRNTNTIRYVMKNGELFDGDTLDELWPTAKKRPAPWWVKEAPNSN